MVQYRYSYGILALILCLAGAGATCNLAEKCQKDFQITGKVTGAEGKPLSGVEVVIGDAVIAKTDKNGKYTYTLEKTRTWFAGRNLKFEKKGYRSSESPAFTEDESGSNVCGAVSLKRDAVLRAQ